MKKMIALLLALTMALSLAACGSKTGKAAETAEETTAETAAQTTAGAESQTQAADSDVADIQKKGTLVVGITDFAPMDYKDDSGNWIGFDADMAKVVADKLGVECQFVEIDWDNKILELENKSIDCVWNGMTLTDEVLNSMECTNAYCNNAQVVVVPSDKAGEYADSESLSGLTFAVEDGSAGMAAADDAGYEYNAVASQADALMEVAAGTSDAAIIDLLMAGAMIGEGTSYPDLAHTVELTTEEYGVGCRKGSDLAAYINDVLAESYADGSLMKTAETYGVQDAIIPQ